MPNDEAISVRLTIRGDKQLWLRFVNKVRERKKVDKKSVWGVLREYILAYLASN